MERGSIAMRWRNATGDARHPAGDLAHTERGVSCIAKIGALPPAWRKAAPDISACPRRYSVKCAASITYRRSEKGNRMYQHIRVPGQGQKISVNRDFTLAVPDNPIIPFIEGDGTGVDITPV